MRRRLALLAPLALIAVAAAHSSGGGISFTKDQVQKGAGAYAQSCATCHGSQLEGGAGPALTGPNFKTLSSKVGAHVGDIFTFMASDMPLNNPASLPHTTYVDIMAYILSKNGFKPGKSPLTYDKAMNSKAPIIH